MFPILQFMAWFDEVEAQVQASQEKCYRLGFSLFTKPFPPPTHTEGEALGDLVMCSYVR